MAWPEVPSLCLCLGQARPCWVGLMAIYSDRF
uniref:Uncharacterized protein n=1 Tax=Oryza sativa subsp. japonica TaxID=39947 RepID=Q2QM46_ORYSJ|nr:hypothetical protein LOC_Os12g42319 [Oryza sativa Japonica Group]